MPVQLIWGAVDPTFPVALARKMLKQFPDARLLEIPDARLLVHEEKPESVNALFLYQRIEYYCDPCWRSKNDGLVRTKIDL